jgi:hypothetical protein
MDRYILLKVNLLLCAKRREGAIKEEASARCEEAEVVVRDGSKEGRGDGQTRVCGSGSRQIQK